MEKISVQIVGRADDTSAWSLRILTLTKVLGGILFFALLHNPVQAVQSVPLAWDSSPDSTVVGYYIYYGGASSNYTTRVDADNATNVTIPGLIEGTTYYFAATAYNSSNQEGDFSNEIGYTVPAPNNPPIVTLTAPLDGANYPAPAALALAAGVTANGHVISTVQFYNGATLLGEDTSAPYSWTWNNAAAGNYNLSARAVYGAGSTVASTSANVTVANPNPAPTIALTSPANGTSYTAPAAIALAAGVTANGHAITTVQFYNGATLLGEDPTAPYNWTWNNVSAGSYSLTARVLYDAGSSLDSSPVNLAVTSTSTNLPAPWQTADIGNVGVAGSANQSGGLYTVQGAGNLSGTADNFRFVYQTLTGDGQITARLLSVQNTGPNGAIGVMIRESLTSGSKCDFMGVLPDRRFRVQHRRTTSGITDTYTGNAAPLNYWVRLVRTGDLVYSWSSTDGVNWSRLNYIRVSMATSVQIGLVIASGTTNSLNTATFGNVTVVP